MRIISTLGLSVAILATAGWLAQASAQAAPDNSAPAAPSSDSSAPAPSTDSSAPAPADSSAAPAKPMHKHHAKGVHRGATTKGDAAVEDLNAQSLNAAKSGTAFKPATTPTPDKAPMKGKGKGKPMHHHHKKAAAAPAADSSAPAPDSSAPAPDSSGK